MTPKGCEELLPTAKWHIFLTTVSGVLLSVMICSTNALILLGIYRNTSLQCVTNYFLAVLAFSDFFVGFVAIPIWVVRSLAGVADEDHPLSKAADCIYVFSVGTSTYSLCAVSLERYIGVIFPLRYNTVITMARFKFAVASIWFVSFVIACLRLVVCEDDYWITAVLTVFCLPGILISFSYFFIFKEVRRQHQTIGDQSRGTVETTHVQNKKASITIAIVIGVFYLTSLPALAFSIAEVLSSKGASCQDMQSTESWGSWTLFITYSNAALNPWIYAARKREFKDALKKLMFWRHHC